MCNNFTPILTLLLLLYLPYFVRSSIGDESQYFKTCTNHCSSVKCRGGQYLRFLDQQPWWMQAMGWGCLNECHYKCTWQTVHYFSSTQQIVPHFYGQYPLERVAGLQRKKSIFSKKIQKFKFFQIFINFRCMRSRIRWFTNHLNSRTNLRTPKIRQKHT